VRDFQQMSRSCARHPDFIFRGHLTEVFPPRLCHSDLSLASVSILDSDEVLPCGISQFHFPISVFSSDALSTLPAFIAVARKRPAGHRGKLTQNSRRRDARLGASDLLFHQDP
jgi:hypothetical protein